jgi:hypothetical protein
MLSPLILAALTPGVDHDPSSLAPALAKVTKECIAMHCNVRSNLSTWPTFFMGAHVRHNLPIIPQDILARYHQGGDIQQVL